MSIRSGPVLVLLVVALGAVAYGDPPAPKALPDRQAIDPAAVRTHVEYLAAPELEGRGTPQGKKLAADYIERHFRELGLKPLFGTSCFQEIPGAKDDAGKPTVMGRNIGAWLRGRDEALRDEFVIVSAHYDHLGIRSGKVYPGADDNAGSVAMLLEVARRLAGAPDGLRRSVVFLSCDLEEHLLWGSRWFVSHPPWPIEQVKLFVTSEMIGRTLGDLPMKTLFVLGTEHATGLKEIVDSLPVTNGLEIAHLGVDLIGNRSDYGPFRSSKVPFVFFSGGEHPDYHQPADTPDRLDYDRVAGVSQMILELMRRAAGEEELPGWTDSPRHGLDEVRTLNRITGLLLETDDAARANGSPRLSNVQRFTVSNMHAQTSEILKRGELKPEERPVLIRASQLLLLTVF